MLTDRCTAKVWIVTLILATALLFPSTVRAQGDGPKTYLLAPTGMSALTLVYLDMESNFNFAGDILIKDADIESDIGVLSYVHFFGVGDRFAQIWVNGIWGTVRGNILVGDDPPPLVPFPPGTDLEVPSESGFADPYVAMRVGLIGAPALGLADFVKHKPGFQMHALLGVAPPLGDYEGDRPINLGTHRWAFRLGLPMVLPIGSSASQTNLEIVPSLMIYTDNTDPFGADLREQDPLAIVESHLTHNLTKKLWGGVDLRYQVGGKTITDGVSDDNRINQLGGGLTLGYNATSSWTIYGSYGDILTESDGSRATMFRLRATRSF